MKHIIIAMIMLLPVFAGAQVPDTVRHRPVDLKEISATPAGVKTYLLVPVDSVARQQASTAQQAANSAFALASPPPIDIYDNTYTLQPSDNGKTLYVRVTCTITCPALPADFKCKIVRVGTASSAVVTINGAASVYGYKRLLQPEASVEIFYDSSQKAHMDGRLSK